MAFPTTGLLSDFSEPGAPGIKFSNLQAATPFDWTTTSGQVHYDGAGGQALGYYNVSTFGADSEAYMTVVTLPVGDSCGLVLRAKDQGTAGWDGYQLFVAPDATPDTWGIYRVDDGTLTQLGVDATQNISAGDKIGFEVIGSTLKGYRFNAGAWTEILSRTDATYALAGYIGAYLSGDSAARFDDFSGGTVVVAGGPFDDGTKTKVSVSGPMALSYFAA